MATPKLTERQRLVLQAVVEDYIATAEPVGSRTVARRHITGVSPATIRNDMADLEELGLLDQPHTSAGRIPSDVGYRYYVDEIVEESPVPDEQMRVIERVLGSKMRQVEALVQATVRVLADASSLVSIIIGPQLAPASLVKVEVAHVGEGRALLVLVTDAGFVETRLMDVPEGLDPDGLRRMTEIINSLTNGRTWESLSRPSALRDLRRSLSGYEDMLDDTIDFLRSSLDPVASERIYVSGVARILDLPEFRDLERAKVILDILEQEPVVSGILLERLAGGVTVTIGRENKRQEMAECSLVTAPYHIGGRAAGTVAILGPRRMDYGLLLSLVDFVAINLDGAFERLA